MHSDCGKCGSPLILHRVRWQQAHLAHCYSCKSDLSQEVKVPAVESDDWLHGVDGIFSMLSEQDKETFAAVHFLEAFVDQWIRLDGVGFFVQKSEQYGFNFDAGLYNEFPFLFRTVVAYCLWHDPSAAVKAMISDHQSYFNLVVRSFGRPEVMEGFHRVLRQDVDLTEDLIRETSKKIKNNGRKPTVKRVSKRLLCSTKKLQCFLEEERLKDLFPW